MSADDTSHDDRLEKKGKEDAEKVIQVAAQHKGSSPPIQIDYFGFLRATFLLSLVGFFAVLLVLWMIEVFV